MYQTLKKILFQCNPETTHHLAEFFLRHLAKQPLAQDILASLTLHHDGILHHEVCKMQFSHPIGLAAGFDKNATMIEGLALLGFAFLELGTITKMPQSGNPKPRLFRHIQEQSLQNAMGFNNDGASCIAKRLQQYHPFSIPLGINLGKNKEVEQKDALKNYEDVLKDFLDLGDYFVFNLSSPNTPNLRDLQNSHFVKELFCMARSHTHKPLFLKISPDMPIDLMLEVCQEAIQNHANGIIATNTTIDYSCVKNPKDIGGISGRALEQKSFEILKILAQAFFKQTTLISVGGIYHAKEAYRRLRHGASLLQVYSALIFEGPTLCKRMNEELASLIKADGFSNITEVIGIDL